MQDVATKTTKQAKLLLDGSTECGLARAATGRVSQGWKATVDFITNDVQYQTFSISVCLFLFWMFIVFFVTTSFQITPYGYITAETPCNASQTVPSFHEGIVEIPADDFKWFMLIASVLLSLVILGNSTFTGHTAVVGVFLFSAWNVFAVVAGGVQFVHIGVFFFDFAAQDALWTTFNKSLAHSPPLLPYSKNGVYCDKGVVSMLQGVDMMKDIQIAYPYRSYLDSPELIIYNGVFVIIYLVTALSGTMILVSRLFKFPWLLGSFYERKRDLYRDHLRALLTPAYQLQLLFNQQKGGDGVHSPLLPELDTTWTDASSSIAGTSMADEIDIEFKLVAEWEENNSILTVFYLRMSIWWRRTSRKVQTWWGMNFGSNHNLHTQWVEDLLANSRDRCFVTPMRMKVGLIGCILGVLVFNATLFVFLFVGIIWSTKVITELLKGTGLEPDSATQTIFLKLFLVVNLTMVLLGTVVPLYMTYKVYKAFRKDVLYYRTHKVTGAVTRADITDVAYFAPYFCASTILGTIVIMFVGFLLGGFIALLVLVPELGKAIITSPTMWVLIATYVGKRVLFWILRIVLLDKTGTRIVHRFAFGFTDYATIFYALPTGVVSALLRVVVPLAQHLAFIGRVDIGNFPKDFETFDLGHRSYLALVLVEVLHSNPIVYTFCDMITQEINRKRLRQNVGCGNCCCCCGTMAASGSLNLDTERGSQLSRSFNSADAPPGNCPRIVTANRRREQRIFYFWVLYTLVKNPCLLPYRKTQLGIVHEGTVAVRSWGRKVNRRLVLKPYVLVVTTMEGDPLITIDVVTMAVSSSAYHPREFQVVDLKQDNTQNTYVFRTTTTDDHHEWLETLISQTEKAQLKVRNPMATVTGCNMYGTKNSATMVSTQPQTLGDLKAGVAPLLFQQPAEDRATRTSDTLHNYLKDLPIHAEPIQEATASPSVTSDQDPPNLADIDEDQHGSFHIFPPSRKQPPPPPIPPPPFPRKAESSD